MNVLIMCGRYDIATLEMCDMATNELQHRLEELGHEVAQFREGSDFQYEIDARYADVRLDELMRWYDACILVCPAGPIGYMNYGYALGIGDACFSFVPRDFDPSLHDSSRSVGDVVNRLQRMFDLH